MTGTSLRVATGLALVAAILAAVYAAPTLIWLGLVIVFLAAAAWEWARLIQLGPLQSHAFVGATALLGTALLTGPAPDWAPAYWGSLGFWLILAPLWLARGWPLPGPLLGAFVGWLLLLPAGLAMLFLRETNPHLLVAFIALSGIADSAAYFAGRAFGRHKLAPRISPGKTWEGAAGAAVTVTVFALALAQTGLIPCEGGCGLRLVAAFLGLFVLSVLGDLFESWIKRQAGVKDSGTLLPGHGGVLDRVDSHLAVLPVAALLWLWLQG